MSRVSRDFPGYSNHWLQLPIPTFYSDSQNFHISLANDNFFFWINTPNHYSNTLIYQSKVSITNVEFLNAWNIYKKGQCCKLKRVIFKDITFHTKEDGNWAKSGYRLLNSHLHLCFGHLDLFSSRLANWKLVLKICKIVKFTVVCSNGTQETFSRFL